MEKRVLLAVFLSFLVLWLYQALVPQPKPRTREELARTEQSVPSATGGKSALEAPAGGAGTVAVPAEPTALPPAVVGDVAARDIVIETPLYTAVFSNRGAALTNWRLKHYKDQHGRLVDLIPAGLPPNFARPFMLRAPDTELTGQVNAALYRVGGPLGDGGAVTSDASTLTFDYQDDSGVRVQKTFRFDPVSYIVRVSASLSRGTETFNPEVLWGPGLGDSMHAVGQSSTFGTYVQLPQGILLEDGKERRLPASTVVTTPNYQGPFLFAGIDDHYFLSSVIKPGMVRITYEPSAAPMPGSQTLQRDMMAYRALFAQPPVDMQFFVGPKDFDVLARVDPQLTKSIHFGMFSFLAVPLLRALKWINASVGNYGWSIIILTVLINAAMFPLRHKSVVSMRRMQELQPQVKAIQDRYAKFKTTDPARQKMNQEMMELYRQKGVNPASGCVPMLLTMPVLFAFYSMLSVAIEIKNQPFALWITDLSAHDPYYITPVLMGATMLWQQSLTPVADPAQQKVMMLTPLMFLVFFLWAPSGLVLYWLVSNVLSIAQTYMTNRIIGKPIVKQVRPAAERKLKNAGSGKTEGAQ
jgi:YidC/Oxa1 family membrane protein insertase